MVSDFPAGDRNVANFFYSVPIGRHKNREEYGRKISSSRRQTDRQADIETSRQTDTGTYRQKKYSPDKWTVR